ncbi:MAG: hypothetical protein WKF76_11080 [Nocardioidaceae bacterium]
MQDDFCRQVGDVTAQTQMRDDHRDGRGRHLEDASPRLGRWVPQEPTEDDARVQVCHHHLRGVEGPRRGLDA